METTGSDGKRGIPVTVTPDQLDRLIYPVEGMIDAPRGVLQYIRGTPGATFDKVRKHCELRGDDLELWPVWARTQTGYVSEAAAALLIYQIMVKAATKA